MGLIFIVFIGIVGSLIANELYAWAPWLSRLLINRAIRRLPEKLRDRYDEEWISELNYIPGGLSQLAFALGIQRAASALIRAEQSSGLKDVMDKVLAGGLLVWILPLFLTIILAIRIDSPGPVLVRQKRYGFKNQEIVVYKFRTIYHNRPREDGVPQARKNDPRVTRVGRILRMTSLDELPLLFNLLQGKISMVGPRPHAVEHNSSYAELIGDYKGGDKIKPGLTGWGQINGYRKEAGTLEMRRSRIEHDIYYVENRSLWMDVKIIVLTMLGAWTTLDEPDNDKQRA